TSCRGRAPSWRRSPQPAPGLRDRDRSLAGPGPRGAGRDVVLVKDNTPMKNPLHSLERLRDFSRQFGGYDGLFQAVETYQAIKALLTDFGKDETHFLHSVDFLRSLVNDLAKPPAQPKVSKRLGVRRRGRPTREEVDPTQPTLEDVIAQVLEHSKEGL